MGWPTYLSHGGRVYSRALSWAFTRHSSHPLSNGITNCLMISKSHSVGLYGLSMRGFLWPNLDMLLISRA